MKRIATGLGLALLMLTNSGNAQNIDSIESRYTQSKNLIEILAKRKVSDKDLLSATKNLQENIKIDSKKISQGGVGSGGGTIVRSGQDKGLLDLYLYNQKAFFSSEKGVILPSTRTYSDFGFDILENANTSIVQRSLAQVEKWRASSPFMTAFISKALKELPVFYVKSSLAFKDQMVFIPSGMKFPADSMSLGAYYIRNLGALVDKKTFDGLSLQNQMALLIHEALRHQQMTFDSGMSNEEVQKLTGLTMRDPTAGISLDRVAYLEPLLQRLLQDAEADIQIKAHAQNICRTAADTCYLLEEEIKYSIADRNYGLVNLLEANKVLFADAMDLRFSREERNRFFKVADLTYGFARDLALNSPEFKTVPLATEYSSYMWNAKTKSTMAKLAQEYNKNERENRDGEIDLERFIEEMKKMGVLVD